MNCIHLWVLPTDGKLIRGVCRKCGTMELFKQDFGEKPYLSSPLFSKAHKNWVGRLKDAQEVIDE